MNKTTIPWALNPDGTPGWTWNPITGCLNHVEGICKGGNFPCFAYRLANGRLRSRYLANRNIAPIGTMIVGAAMGEKAIQDPFYPQFWEHRILEPRDEARGKGIFVCDMSDLFGIGIPEEWTRRVLKEIPICHDNRFYLLTKQPQNLIKFSPFPDNCWVGVTITNNDAYYQSNDVLLKLKPIKAKVKYISFEPLLERIWAGGSEAMSGDLQDAGIGWVIIGAQTKPYKPPKIEWVHEIIEACKKASIPVFLKDNLVPAFNEYNKRAFPHHPHLWDMKGLLRQEVPR